MSAQQDSLRTQDLEDIIVSASASYATKKLEAGVIELSISDVFKLPASFFDPARLAQNFSGVAGNNDQANGLSIRGNNPEFLKWFMEGVEIVNPNHTNNAGTFSDRPTQSSGGVNILSAQLLNTTQLYKGNYPVQYNNALSGLLSMSLRPGSFQERKHVFQAGLIGLEFATEGPLGKNNKASYLLNYRYSTVGLLSQLGLDFGGEKIAFQDLSMIFSFLTKTGMVKAFAIGGFSENDFENNADPSEWETQKDRFNIQYDNLMNAVGLSWTGFHNNQARFNSSLVYSGLNTNRTSDFKNINGTIDEGVEIDERSENKISFLYNQSRQLKRNFGLEMGFRSSLTWFDFRQMELRIPTLFSGADSYFENAIHLEYSLKQKFLSFKLGFNVKHLFFNQLDNQEFTFEPRFSYAYTLLNQDKIVLAGGFYSQVNPYTLYFSEGILVENESLKQSKSVLMSLAYLKQFSNTAVFNVEAFAQRLLDIPVGRNARDDFSFINGSQDLRFLQFANRGEGLNYGIEISFEKRNEKDYLRPYYIINGTLYESRFRNSSDEEWRSTRFNGNYIFNFTTGKTFGKKNLIKQNGKNVERSFGINTHINYLGGFRERPIDVTLSNAEQKTVFDKDQDFTLKQKDYFRIDASIYLQKVKSKYKSRLSLDIQNVLNRKNEAFSFYDAFQNQILLQEQLGIIPVLNYRIEF